MSLALQILPGDRTFIASIDDQEQAATMVSRRDMIFYAIVAAILFLTSPLQESFDDAILRLEAAIHTDCQNERKVDSGFDCVFDEHAQQFKLHGFEPRSLADDAMENCSVLGLARLAKVMLRHQDRVYNYYFVGILGNWYHIGTDVDKEPAKEQRPQYEHSFSPTSYKREYAAPAIHPKTTHTGTQSA